MRTFFLKFSSEASAQSVMQLIGLYVILPSTEEQRLEPPSHYEDLTQTLEDGLPVNFEIEKQMVDFESYYRTGDHYFAMDIIGEIKKGGQWNLETGEELEAPTIIEGWHINYAANELPVELEPYLLSPPPSSPVRVFAGLD